MKKYILLAAGLISLSACDLEQEFKEMLPEIEQRQERAQSLVRDKYGWSSHLGYELENENLMQATLSLNSEKVSDRTVGELYAIALEVIDHVFEPEPQIVYLHIKSVSDDERE